MNNTTKTVVLEGVRMSVEAARAAQAVGADDVQENVRLMRRGLLTREALLAHCLDGTDGDEALEDAWREYVSAIALAAEEPPRTVYTIRSLNGAYIRPGMTTAESEDEARATMLEAMRYLGSPDAVVVDQEDGDLVAYVDREDADNDLDGSRGTLIAQVKS